MSNESGNPKKYAVEKYLEQVKILTALATALLLPPNAIIAFKSDGIESAVGALDPGVKIWLLIMNISFIAVIIMTYFIYSAIVGHAHDGEYDIYRPAARIFSILQFAGILLGCIALIVLFSKLV